MILSTYLVQSGTKIEPNFFEVLGIASLLNASISQKQPIDLQKSVKKVLNLYIRMFEDKYSDIFFIFPGFQSRARSDVRPRSRCTPGQILCRQVCRIRRVGEHHQPARPGRADGAGNILPAVPDLSPTDVEITR